MATTITNALFIPIAQKEPHQEQTTTLDGRPYLLRFNWNQRIQRWTLSISAADGTSLLQNKAIVIGADLLQQSRHDPRLPQGVLMVFDTTNLDVDPTLDTLGLDQVLAFIPPEFISVT